MRVPLSETSAQPEGAPGPAADRRDCGSPPGPPPPRPVFTALSTSRAADVLPITSSGPGVHVPARPLGLGAHIASPWGSVPAPGIGPRPAGHSPSGKAGAAADAEDPSRTQREELKWEMGKPSRKRGAWSPAAGAKRVAAQRDRLWSCLQASCDRQHTGLPAALSGQRDVPCAVSWRQNAGPPWLAPRTDRTGDQPGEERGRQARGRPPGVPRVRRDPRAGPPAGLHLSSSEARGSPAHAL